jgi:hypothetical protein
LPLLLSLSAATALGCFGRGGRAPRPPAFGAPAVEVDGDEAVVDGGATGADFLSLSAAPAAAVAFSFEPLASGGSNGASKSPRASAWLWLKRGI